MSDYIDIGPTPASEPCQQVGNDYDIDIARAECRAFLRQIVRIVEPECVRRGYQWGDVPCSLRIRSHAHDFGSYLEVAVKYDECDEEASDLAYWIEANAPDVWDDQGRADLATLKEGVK